MSKIELANLLHSQIEHLGIKRTELAERARISRQTLYKLLNAEIEEARLSTIIRLSNALKLHPIDVMRVYLGGSSIKSHRGDNPGFFEDVTYPDNSPVLVNQTFTKTWAVKNTGSATWRNRKLICMDNQFQANPAESDLSVQTERGLKPLSRTVDIPVTAPGEKVQISVTFKAPSYPCTTISNWKSLDENGKLIFPEKEGLSCLVNVVAF